MKFGLLGRPAEGNREASARRRSMIGRARDVEGRRRRGNSAKIRGSPPPRNRRDGREGSSYLIDPRVFDTHALKHCVHSSEAADKRQREKEKGGCPAKSAAVALSPSRPPSWPV